MQEAHDCRSETKMRSIQLQVPVAKRVLDFGCGTGWVLGEASYQGDCFRVGVDISIDSLKTAARCCPVAAVTADGLQLPFASESFDVVVGHVSMPYMNTERALEEIHRVLAPGGSLLLTFHSFFYLRQRFRGSLRARNWKDVLFSAYMGVNGLLNHVGLPQMQAFWRRTLFETVNTGGGIARTARRQGFTLISVEHAPKRIFFVVTARKPSSETGAVLPAPAWSVYGPLAAEVQADGALYPDLSQSDLISLSAAIATSSPAPMESDLDEVVPSCDIRRS